MNKLMMKARAGVTLVELLVVVLIVTILSVSLLPMLQPFVVEAQYAAEAIPVIGNLRTKLGVYQYDKGKLPNLSGTAKIHSWGYTTDGTNPTTTKSDKYIATKADYGENRGKPVALTTSETSAHIGSALDVDFQDLVGKRCNPKHYQYVCLTNGTDYVYALGCFGDGNGLKPGTGYAVCEIALPSKGVKYIGTWKRYKALNDDQLVFSKSDDLIDSNDPDPKHTKFCYLPEESKYFEDLDSNKHLPIIDTMKSAGWEFN